MGLLGIIPARGGSKGVKNKNIKDLHSKPLIAYSIEAAQRANIFDALIVTSDDEAILAVAKSYGAQVIKRPEELATDTATSDVVIQHALDLMLKDSKLTEFMLLQPTSPLRSETDIQEAWALYQKNDADLLLSVSKVEMELQKAFVENGDGYLQGLLSPDAPFQRRQDLPDVYLPNGAIYICAVSSFRKFQRLPRERIKPYVMPKERSVDIDTLADFALAEQILNKRG